MQHVECIDVMPQEVQRGALQPRGEPPLGEGGGYQSAQGSTRASQGWIDVEGGVQGVVGGLKRPLHGPPNR